MKLPISLLVLAGLSQALSVSITKRSETKTGDGNDAVAKNDDTKSSETKITVAKQHDKNETSKRELFEGNFGERNKEVVHKLEGTGRIPEIVFAKDFQEMVSEQTPAHQVFGMRLPQIVKISDVLSGQAPSLDVAVARQLYSPVSVYQTRYSSPTSFEVPSPAASQSGYSNQETYRQQISENEQKLQVLPKSEEQSHRVLSLYKVNQPRLRFESYPQPLDPEVAGQYETLSSKDFRSQETPNKQMSLFFPIYDQRGPYRRPGQVVPSQYLHRNGIFQIFPISPDFSKGSPEGNRIYDYPSERNNGQLKGERPKLQVDIPVHKQGYHAHPNGAISFARFTHNLPDSTQHATVAQPSSETFHQQEPAQYHSQTFPVQLQPQIQAAFALQSQEPKVSPSNQKLPYPPMLQALIQDLEKYQPVFKQQTHFNLFEKPRTVNALQQHLLHQDPQQSSNLQIIQLQRVPEFGPQPQSLLSPEPHLQKTSERKPRPFSYTYQIDTQPQSENYGGPVGQASAELNALPPLKPNYNKYVKPLEPHTTPTFLPTPSQPLLTSTVSVEPVPDQLISSTTIKPEVKGQEGSKTQSIQDETESQSPTPEPQPEVIHQSQPTVSPTSDQSTAYLPFVTNEPHSIFFQYSTPQPAYQSTTPRPSPPQQQRHDVVIQRQEIQEIFFEPPHQPSNPPQFGNQHKLFLPYREHEVRHLQAQPNHPLFEQLLPYRQSTQQIHSPLQYIVEARQSQQQPSLIQGHPQQYLIQQQSHPLQLQQFQPTLLQHQHSELEQQPQGSNQAQKQYQESDQTQQQQQAQQQQQQQNSFELSKQQQESDQAQHEQALEQVKQQVLQQAQHQQEAHRQVLEQAQHQQQAQYQQQAQPQQEVLEQQKQELEQAQQLSQESKQAQKEQYQLHSLASRNEIQISTSTPPQNIEKQTETVEVQQQTESQTEVQTASGVQSTTGKPNERHLSGPTSNVEQPYLGPFLYPSLDHQLFGDQQLEAQPEASPLLDVQSNTDVQYFGKFARALFGAQNHQH